jgi:hypothetical protein
VSGVGGLAGLAPLANLMTMTAPIAHNSDGSTITGPVRSEFILSSNGAAVRRRVDVVHKHGLAIAEAQGRKRCGGEAAAR